MPALSIHDIVKAIQQACEEGGGFAHFDKSSIRHNPRNFEIVTSDNNHISLWVYVWTLTFGGRATLPNEYRIQMTGVNSPLAMKTGHSSKTILIGYEPKLDAFAGFDIRKHRIFTQGSPSIQININALRRALALGMAFDKKTNDEIAIGFRKDNFLNYVTYSDMLHEYGVTEDATESIERLEQVVSEDEFKKEIRQYEQRQKSFKRKTIVTEVSRLSRRSNFREKVLRVYGRKCAVTGIQLKLGEAAHILPVAAPGSDDSINNGLLLSPTYHKAFDLGLIYLDTN